MNDTFGAVSHQDFLPPNYGDIPSKTIVRMAPNGSADESIFPDNSDSSQANPAPTPRKNPEPEADDGLGAILAQIPGAETPVAKPNASSADVGPGLGDYYYRIYSDGSVLVLKGPKGNINKKYAADSEVAANIQKEFPEEFDAVTSASAASPTTDSPVAAGLLSLFGGGGASGAAGTTGSGSTTGYSSRRVETAAAVGTGIGAAATQLLPLLGGLLGTQTVTPYDDEFIDTGSLTSTSTSSSGSALPWVLGGVGLLTVAGLGVFLITRGGDDEE